MSGYTPIFRSIFHGTLCGKYPELPVWLVLLALADRHGEIDAHPSYIATVSGLPQADIEAAIHSFCQPDDNSRSPDEDGRRLVPIPGRGFGWTIVNHGKYREKARLAAKSEREVESGANAERMQYRRRPPETAEDRRPPPATDPSDSDADSNKKTPSVSMARKRAAPPRRRCPDGFQVPDSERAKIRSECPDVDLLTEERKFRDHEFARGRSDWLATWRNWMREAQTRSTKVNGHHARPTRYDELRARSKAKSELPREPSALTQMLIEAKL